MPVVAAYMTDSEAQPLASCIGVAFQHLGGFLLADQQGLGRDCLLGNPQDCLRRRRLHLHWRAPARSDMPALGQYCLSPRS